MADQANYGQHIGRVIVGHALRMPGTDVAWPLLPDLAAGVWMTNAVECAALEARVPQCEQNHALKGGA